MTQTSYPGQFPVPKQWRWEGMLGTWSEVGSRLGFRGGWSAGQSDLSREVIPVTMTLTTVVPRPVA